MPPYMRSHLHDFISFALCSLLWIPAHAQQDLPVVQGWLQDHRTELGLTDKDVTQWAVTSSSSNTDGVSFIYIQQQANGLPVYGAVANFAVRSGKVVHHGVRLIADVAGHAPSPQPGLDAMDAVRQAANQLGLVASDVHVLRTVSATSMEIAPSGIAHDPIQAELIYQPVAEGGLKLAWDLTIRSNSSIHWWHLAVDAGTGRILRNTDHTVECAIPSGSFTRPYDAALDLALPEPLMPLPMPPSSDAYRVFALPVESPSYGPRTLVTGPSDAVASPYGWHDVNGVAGAEYTITRGNNVYASEDINADDVPGYSPDGGTELDFDFPLNLPQAPSDYLDAAITNLFYCCNVLHDVWQRYGFDEAAGNFQKTNYSGEGFEDDEVRADAQDGSGSNNANFSTPSDGYNGRMQMFTWTTGDTEDSSVVVNSPSGIAGSYESITGGFGPELPEDPLTEDLVLVQDDTDPLSDGCESISNAVDLAGKIALVDRGLCTFVIKVQALQDAGALAVIVVNNVGGGPIMMGGTSSDITIPAVMISQADGAAMKAALLNGAVNVTLQAPSHVTDLDGDIDNGVIMHEYGHGVSTRLTGGGGNSDCLNNDEQMGEGWSDWMAITLTMEEGDQGTDVRGMGTYVLGEPVDGGGLRPAPYSTDPSVNDFTYGSTNNVFQIAAPHGIGFVWATMLWDLNWALVDAYGFDPDIHTGTGGNNIAMQLVIDGLKLQPCSPGFVDGRDAILAADQIDNDGANQCLIWHAFANRGLGYSADQGSPYSRTDQVEAFDVPPGCIGSGIDDIRRGRLAEMSLVPNPANNAVNVMFAEPLVSAATLTIYSAEGRVMSTRAVPLGSTNIRVDLAGLPQAIYQVQVRGTGLVMDQRLVVTGDR